MEVLDILKNYKLKATPQRLSILKILKKHEHPTIDELYSQVKQEYPFISLATVYKNLNILQEQGLVVEINISNQKTCYDIYENKHMHLICSNCLSIEDIDFEKVNLNNYQEQLEKNIKNSINHLSVNAYTNTCKKCDSL